LLAQAQRPDWAPAPTAPRAGRQARPGASADRPPAAAAAGRRGEDRNWRTAPASSRYRWPRAGACSSEGSGQLSPSSSPPPAGARLDPQDRPQPARDADRGAPVGPAAAPVQRCAGRWPPGRDQAGRTAAGDAPTAPASPHCWCRASRSSDRRSATNRPAAPARRWQWRQPAGADAAPGQGHRAVRRRPPPQRPSATCAAAPEQPGSLAAWLAEAPALRIGWRFRWMEE
jgi:hypothetical protein